MLKHRITLRLSDEDKRLLDELTVKLGESRSTVIKRTIAYFYDKNETPELLESEK